MGTRLEEVLAQRLRDLARERGMPISHVADRCGMAHSYFWRLLRSEASATLAVVQRLAEALGVPPLALLGTERHEAPRARVKLAAEKARHPRKAAKPRQG